ALLDAVEKAISIASCTPLKNLTGEYPPMNFSASEYVTSVCSTSAPNTTATYAPNRTSSSQPNSTAKLNMKQNTAYGASLMTSPIRVIETSNRPSMPRRKISMPGVALLTTMPTPNISAK